MNHFAQYITNKLIKEKVLEEGRKAEYTYATETLLEKVIFYIMFLVIALCLHLVLPTAVFLIFFMNIRERTGGFHMDTFMGCLFGSAVIYLYFVLTILPNAIQNPYIVYIAYSVSIICILLIGTVNHPNMNMNANEFMEAKKSARILAILHWSIITTLWLILQNNIYISCAVFADVLCAALLLLAK